MTPATDCQAREAPVAGVSNGAGLRCGDGLRNNARTSGACCEPIDAFEKNTEPGERRKKAQRILWNRSRRQLRSIQKRATCARTRRTNQGAPRRRFRNAISRQRRLARERPRQSSAVRNWACGRRVTRHACLIAAFRGVSVARQRLRLARYSVRARGRRGTSKVKSLVLQVPVVQQLSRWRRERDSNPR